MARGQRSTSAAADDNYSELLHFLPDLGISYMLWNQAEGRDPNPVAATRIGVVQK
jgi:hypothetical protein